MGDPEDLIDALAHMAEEIADDVRRAPLVQPPAKTEPKKGGEKRGKRG